MDAGEVDVVFDVIGGDILDRSVALVRAGGTLVTIAMPPKVHPKDGRAVFFVVEPDRARLADLATRLRDGRLKPVVGAVRPLAEAPAAFAPRQTHPRQDDHPRQRRPNRRPLMIGMQIASGLLAVATLAGTTACTAPDQSTPATTPTVSTRSQPPTETLTPLFEQALPNVQGKTFTSTIVDFPPGARAVPHRHGEAFVYAYVLEGTVRSQLDDKPMSTYRQGENWVEPPGAHHVLTENTSQAERARLLVVFVSNTGEPLKVDDPNS